MRLAVGILRATALLGASSVTVALVGFLKNILAAYFFGTSGAMDAYLLALVIPDLTMHLAGTGAFNFIPLFASERARSEKVAWSSAGKLLTYWLFLLAGAIAIASIATAPLIRVVGPGLEPGLRETTVDMTRLLLWMAAPVGAARLLAMVLYAEKRFLASASSEAIFQIVSTAYFVLFHSWGVASLVWGQIIGGAVQLLVIGVALRNRRHQIRPDLDFRSEPVAKAIRLSLPVYVGNVAAKLNNVVNRAFASLLGVGAVSSLQYAALLVESPVRILASSLTAALFPFLSEQFASKEIERSRDAVAQAIRTTTVLFLPLAVFMFVAATPLVQALFERGSFDARSTELTVGALQILAPAVLALGLNELLGSVFHSRQEPRVPLTAGLARVTLNVLLCALLSPVLGHRGIALALTVSAYFKLGVLWMHLRGFLGSDRTRELLKDAARSLGAGATTLALAWFAAEGLERFVQGLAPFRLALVALTVGAGYVAALRLFCPEELSRYRTALRALYRKTASLNPSGFSWARPEEGK
ncbi:MAG: murein biosynthesis integral membrane protein MurJ [Vicinamibacteria bacterium]